jgi:GTPase SAR1 family protein
MEEIKLDKPAIFPAVNSYDELFKIIIIGDPCCGKTSLLLRTTMSMKNEVYETTVGVDCKSRTFNFKNK